MNKHKIALITDSCADIPMPLLKKYHIYVVPLRLLFSDGDYLDGVNITPRQVYERLPKELPKTTLPSGELVEAVFSKIQQAGYDKVIAIHFSSGLSGTYNMMRVVAEQFPALQTMVFDTRSGSLGTGMTVLQAARWIAQGQTFEQIAGAIPALIASTKVFFCIDTLQYLQKGGRVGKISAVTGTLLQIKPIVSFTDEGELVSVAKVRGKKQAIEKMVQMAAALVPRGTAFHLAVAHGDCPQELKEIRTLAQKALPDYQELMEGEIDCTLGAYVGPHLVGIGIQRL